MGAERDALDAALDTNSRPIKVRRVVGTAPNQQLLDCDARAVVTDYNVDDLVADIQQGMSHVIMSPTDLERQGWPGGLPANALERTRYPLNTDLCIVDGKARKIDGDANLLKIGEEIVRIEFDILG